MYVLLQHVVAAHVLCAYLNLLILISGTKLYSRESQGALTELTELARGLARIGPHYRCRHYSGSNSVAIPAYSSEQKSKLALFIKIELLDCSMLAQASRYLILGPAVNCY